MKHITEIEELIGNVRTYLKNEKDINDIYEAFNIAASLHKGQKRLSGEEYVIHPLNVAYILSTVYSDKETIISGLLHDTVEDCEYTLEDVKNKFGLDIMNIVEGVTNINLSKTEDQDIINQRRILTAIKKDFRIILVKLADRLHNMSTLYVKPKEKQVKKAIETLEIFVPLAKYLGMYKIHIQLQDYSFQYIKRDVYKYITNKMNIFINNNMQYIEEMIEDINLLLLKKNIDVKLEYEILDNFNIYKKLIEKIKFTNIYDLVMIKIIVKNVDDCYKVLGIIHSKYPHMAKRIKDYISLPKSNLYQSIHTTVFGKNNKFYQILIRTEMMDYISNYGVTYYFLNKDKTELLHNINNFDFINTINSFNNEIVDNRNFINSIKNEVLVKNIYVYTKNGKTISLPTNSTPLDFAYTISNELGNNIIGAIVNNKYVSINSILKNRDVVRIITDISSYPKMFWLEYNILESTKRKIMIYFENNNN